MYIVSSGHKESLVLCQERGTQKIGLQKTGTFHNGMRPLLSKTKKEAYIAIDKFKYDHKLVNGKFEVIQKNRLDFDIFKQDDLVFEKMNTLFYQNNEPLTGELKELFKTLVGNYITTSIDGLNELADTFKEIIVDGFATFQDNGLTEKWNCLTATEQYKWSDFVQELTETTELPLKEEYEPHTPKFSKSVGKTYEAITSFVKEKTLEQLEKDYTIQ